VYFDGISVMGTGGVVSLNRRDGARKLRSRMGEPSEA